MNELTPDGSSTGDGIILHESQSHCVFNRFFGGGVSGDHVFLNVR
jgi:hypothetical protein